MERTGCPLGMYAPACLSLNKKEAQSRDIHKPKRLGSPKRKNLGLENRLNPEVLKRRMVLNVNIAFLLVQGARQTDDF